MKPIRSTFILSICIDAEYAPILKKLVHVYKYGWVINTLKFLKTLLLSNLRQFYEI